MFLSLSANSADLKVGDSVRVVENGRRVFLGKFKSLISDTLYIRTQTDGELRFSTNDISAFYHHHNPTLEFARFGLGMGVLIVGFRSLSQYYSHEKSGDYLSAWWKGNWLSNVGIIVGCGALGAVIGLDQDHYEEVPVNKIHASPRISLKSGNPGLVLELTLKI